MKNIELKISSDDKEIINGLAMELRKIREIKVDRNLSNSYETGMQTRGDEYLNLITILLSSFALPSLVSLLELYVTSRKIELEIEIPLKNTKIKISGLSTDDLKNKLSEIKKISSD
jgi:hypothetical protein